MYLPRAVDLCAAASAVIAAAMLVVYVAVMRSQDDQPPTWVVAALVGGALLAAYGSIRRLPRRPVALAAATVLLGGIGLLALLTIGLPILVAAALAGVAFLGSMNTRAAR